MPYGAAGLYGAVYPYRRNYRRRRPSADGSTGLATMASRTCSGLMSAMRRSIARRTTAEAVRFARGRRALPAAWTANMKSSCASSRYRPTLRDVCFTGAGLAGAAGAGLAGSAAAAGFGASSWRAPSATRSTTGVGGSYGGSVVGFCDGGMVRLRWARRAWRVARPSVRCAGSLMGGTPDVVGEVFHGLSDGLNGLGGRVLCRDRHALAAVPDCLGARDDRPDSHRRALDDGGQPCQSPSWRERRDHVRHEDQRIVRHLLDHAGDGLELLRLERDWGQHDVGHRVGAVAPGVGAGVGVDDYPLGVPVVSPRAQRLGDVLGGDVEHPQRRVAGYESWLAVAHDWSRGPPPLQRLNHGCADAILVVVAPGSGRSPVVPLQVDEHSPRQPSHLVGDGRLAHPPLAAVHRNDLGHNGQRSEIRRHIGGSTRVRRSLCP